MSYHGRRIGRYTLGHCLGSGGMGAVWVARDEKFERDVAIKLLRPDLATSELLLNRFRRELKAMIALKHEHIVRIFDGGADTAEPYIVMELVVGRSLHDMMREGPLPPDEALRVADELLAALEHMHALGFIHRDVKPANVMQEEGGRTVLMDLGLVAPTDRSNVTALTRAGAVVGTPRWMAPEMLATGTGDSRMDLYQVGFVLHELLTGAPPYDSVALVRLAQGDTSIEPAIARPAADAPVAAVLRRGLAADPDRRFTTARAMREALRALDGRAPPSASGSLDDAPFGGLPLEVRVRYAPGLVIARGPLFTWIAARRRTDETAVRLQLLAPALAAIAPPESVEGLRTLTGLTHPHLLVPLEVHFGGAGPCLVQPDPPAPTAGADLGGAPFANRAGWRRAFRALAEALAYLHAQGRPHGHVGPDTLRVSSDGEAWLDGVELHALLAAVRIEQGLEMTRRIWQHAPPEEQDGAPASAPGDVHALVRMMELLAGPAPDGGMPPGWPRVAARALATDPRDRPADAAALLELLVAEAVVDPPGTALRPGHGARQASGPVATRSRSAAPGRPVSGQETAVGPGAWPSGARLAVLGIGALLAAAILVPRARGPTPDSPVATLGHEIKSVHHGRDSILLVLATTVPCTGRLRVWPLDDSARERVVTQEGPPSTSHTFHVPAFAGGEALAFRAAWHDTAGRTIATGEEGQLPSLANRLLECRERLALGLRRRSRTDSMAAPLADDPDADDAGHVARAAFAVPELCAPAYSVVALLDLVEARAALHGHPGGPDPGALLPPELSWTAVTGAPDRAVKARVPVAARPAPISTAGNSPGPRTAVAISMPLDLDAPDIARAWVVLEPPAGTGEYWRSTVFGVSVNGSVELLLRARGASAWTHQLDPTWLFSGTNTLVVRRGTIDDAAPPGGSWRLTLNVTRRR